MTSLAELHSGSCQLRTASEFRLLHILPGNKDAPIKAQLEVCDLKKKPKYEALSYVCGEKSENGLPIYVNGLEVIQTYENLRRFLVRVRSRHHVRTVWVDALCINQEDPEEKAQQVQLMGQIYGNARVVLSWLGEHDTASRKVFQLSLNDHFRQTAQYCGPLLLPLIPIIIVVAIHHHLEMMFDKKPLKSWEAVLDRPYFNRTWTVQELLLAKKIKFYCGKDTMDMRLFEKPLEHFRCTTRSSRLPMVLPRSFLLYFARCQSRRGRKSIKKYYFEERDIFELIYEFRHTECSIPLDRAYALLALQSPSEAVAPDALPMTPDYDISMHDLFVNIITNQLSRKMNDTTCEKVAMLFRGLKLDENDVGETDNQIKNDNAIAIIDMLHHSQAELAIQSTVIRAFDLYGIINPQRTYLITTSDDANKIQHEFETWRRGKNTETGTKPSDAVFRTLRDPLWGRFESSQRSKMGTAARVPKMHGNERYDDWHQQVLQHQLMHDQMMQTQLMQNQLIQDQMQNQITQQNMTG